MHRTSIYILYFPIYPGYISSHSPNIIIDTGVNNSLREFAALLDLVNVLVTGDTLALHLSNALKKKVVAIFGPTSADEIYLYHGTKILPSVVCQCYYKGKCEATTSCMESISPSMVCDAIVKLLKNSHLK